MKRIGLTLLKLAIAAALGWFVISQIQFEDQLVLDGKPPIVLDGELEGNWQDDWTFTSTTDGKVYETANLPEDASLRPGFFKILAGLRLPWMGLMILLWITLLLIVTWRWQLLLRAAGVVTRYTTAMRLCFIGYFFNNVMPGATGGDLIRAVLVTRGLESNRANAAMSVLIDRLIGLFSLLLLAALVLAFGQLGEGENAPQHLDQVAKAVYLLVGGVVLVGALYLSRRVRRFLHIDRLGAILPDKIRQVLSKIDHAITLYRGHMGLLVIALLQSLVLQACGILSFWAIGRGLGALLEVPDYFVIFPVVQTISSVPIAPAGWGIGETMYGKFFQWFGSTFTLGVAVSILFRLTTQVGFGLAGGLVWILSREHKQGVQLNEASQ